MVTEYPRACNNLANEAAIMPLPNDEVTPPVTKIYLVCMVLLRKNTAKVFTKNQLRSFP
jgi:hypothetical protein